ncbi:MAG TPA: hypothetical protein VIG24_19935 [Acidimicrobiia bacterium]
MKRQRGELQRGQRRDRFDVHRKLGAVNYIKALGDHDLASGTSNRPV